MKFDVTQPTGIPCLVQLTLQNMISEANLFITDSKHTKLL